MAGITRKTTGRIPFSHDILPALRKEFDDMADGMTGKKYEIVEGALRAFLAMPVMMRYLVCSKRESEREVVLRRLRCLGEDTTLSLADDIDDALGGAEPR